MKKIKSISILLFLLAYFETTMCQNRNIFIDVDTLFLYKKDPITYEIKSSIPDGNYYVYHYNYRKKRKGYVRTGVTLDFTATIKNKKREGISFYYTGATENRFLSYIESYSNDTLDGLTEGWYDRNKIEFIGNYKKGKKDGKWLFYWEDGALKQSYTYVNDSLRTWETYHDNGRIRCKFSRAFSGNDTLICYSKESIIVYRSIFNNGKLTAWSKFEKGKLLEKSEGLFISLRLSITDGDYTCESCLPEYPLPSEGFIEYYSQENGLLIKKVMYKGGKIVGSSSDSY